MTIAQLRNEIHMEDVHTEQMLFSHLELGCIQLLENLPYLTNWERLKSISLKQLKYIFP